MWQIATMFGLLGAGAASTLFVLWRKAKVEKDLAVTKRDLVAHATEAARLKLANEQLEKTYTGEIERRELVILGLHKEVEALNEALEKLPTGSLLTGLRSEIGIKDDTDLIDPSKE